MTQPLSTSAQRRVRVMQVTGAMDFGGAEKVIAHLASGIDRNRFELKVVCTRGIGVLGEQLREHGVDVELTRPWVHARRHLAPLDLHAVIRRFRPDVVHTHGEPPLAAAGPLACVGLMPHWMHTFHYGNYPYESARRMWLEAFFARRASTLIAVAEQQKSSIVKYHGIAPERIRTVMNGVNPNPYVHDVAHRESRRREFGFAADDFVIGTIAVLSRQKGVTYLLQAAKDVLTRQSRSRLLIVGGGPLEHDLKSEAQQLGLGDRVQFTGWRKDVQEILPALDVFVMSSLWEAMPLTLLEAMAARKAIVVTDVGDNARLVGDASLVVPPADPTRMSEALQQLLQDAGGVEMLGRRALQRFEAHYTVQHMVSNHQNLYASAARV